MVCLTNEERKVVLFLLCMGLLGTSANFIFKNISPAQQNISSINENIGKANLNSASKEALISIPGIGEKLAQRILEYKDKNGAFQDKEELKNIKGITAYRFEKLKDSLYVR